jgi:hypothetical protein
VLQNDGSFRRDRLDDVIVVNERHRKRLMREYVVATTTIDRVSRWRRKFLSVAM